MQMNRFEWRALLDKIKLRHEDEEHQFLASHWPCAECRKEGKDGYIVERTTHCTTLGGWAPHMDKDGYHEHDWNRKTVVYVCNLGHTYELSGYHPCRCGWLYEPAKPDRVIKGANGVDIAIYDAPPRIRCDILGFERTGFTVFNTPGASDKVSFKDKIFIKKDNT